MIEAVLPGIHTSIQDVRPRRGFRWGIAQGGAADRKAAMLANLLLGQEMEAPVLEIVSSSVRLVFHRRARVAVTGGGMTWRVLTSRQTSLDAKKEESAGKQLASWRPFVLDAGEVLVGNPSRPGFRSYLAIEGGFAGEELAGSTSTDLRLGLGGLRRIVRKGDLLKLRPPDPSRHRLLPWSLGPNVTAYLGQEVIRLFPAPETDWFVPRDVDALAATDWALSSDSNRMGLRLLTGNETVVRLPERQLLSTVVLPGTVQMTASGPIILFVDAQTTGGYPRIGQVCEADLPVLAQKAPGSTIRFAWITLDEALDLKRQQAQELRRLAAAVSLP
jgi:biotin-dependent carboxylase-like uncharacterized protein